MMPFTVEQINLMCCFDVSSRCRLIEEMKSVPLFGADKEIEELRDATIKQLETMRDGEFDALYIAPDSLLD